MPCVHVFMYPCDVLPCLYMFPCLPRECVSLFPQWCVSMSVSMRDAVSMQVFLCLPCVFPCLSPCLTRLCFHASVSVSPMCVSMSPRVCVFPCYVSLCDEAVFPCKCFRVSSVCFHVSMCFSVMSPFVVWLCFRVSVSVSPTCVSMSPV